MCNFVAMNLPDKKLCELIDELEQSSVSFALYRLPWEKEPVLVLQREGALHTCAHLQGLNGKTGFVLAPFCPSEQHPVVIIRADRKAEGWAEIADALASIGMAKPVKDRLTSDRHVPAYTRRDYGEAFGRFIQPLREGVFQKLVLSRCETASLPDTFSPLATFVNACTSYPRMMISLVHTPVTGTWIGSTPEIILSAERGRWHTVSLAGTMPMNGEQMPEGQRPGAPGGEQIEKFRKYIGKGLVQLQFALVGQQADGHAGDGLAQAVGDVPVREGIGGKLCLAHHFAAARHKCGVRAMLWPGQRAHKLFQRFGRHPRFCGRHARQGCARMAPGHRLLHAHRVGQNAVRLAQKKFFYIIQRFHAASKLHKGLPPKT